MTLVPEEPKPGTVNTGLTKEQQEIAKRLRVKAPTRTPGGPGGTGQTPAPPNMIQEQTGEPLSERVLRQIRSGEIDEERLLPSTDKRRSDVAKKVQRMRDGRGWYIFVQGNSHTVATAKAPQRRNAELAVIHEASRWRAEIERYIPECVEEFDQMLRRALDTPKAGNQEESPRARG